MRLSRPSRKNLLRATLWLACPWGAAAAPAGIAQFTAGAVELRAPDGASTPLSKGGALGSGQTVLTGADGRVQLRFSDGGLVSLQPATEFRIAIYADEANPDKDRFFVELLSGGMRAITGLIGKRLRANYRVTTHTATIGIRGSAFHAAYYPDGTLGVTTELDAIEVCNAGGCVGLSAGESVRVLNAQELQRTDVRPTLATPAPAQDEALAGSRVARSPRTATAPAVAGVEARTPPVEAPNSGSFTTLRVNGRLQSIDGGHALGPGWGSPAMLEAGKLTAVADQNQSYTPLKLVAAESLGAIADGDFMGWGYWASARQRSRFDTTESGAVDRLVDNLHYVVGQPTLVMPVSGSVPTDRSGASGSLLAGALRADFGTGHLDASVTTSFGPTLHEAGIGIVGAGFVGSHFQGFFSGPGAARAGLSYHGTGAGGEYSGAAVFQAR